MRGGTNRAIIGSLVALVLAAQSSLAAASCMTASELRAERSRTMQSGLMFAALKCIHKPHLGLQDKYNAIMARFGRDLAATSDVVQDYFKRTIGPGHRAALHDHVTSMANRYSVNSFSAPKFCENMAALGENILAGEDDVVLNARFSYAMLLPPLANACQVEADPALAYLNQRVPDLVSIHMPDIDARIRAKLVAAGE